MSAEDLIEVSPERHKLLEEVASPIVGWLMMQDTKVALETMSLVVATIFMSMKYKEGKTPLTLLDTFTKSVRKTLEVEIAARAEVKP